MAWYDEGRARPEWAQYEGSVADDKARSKVAKRVSSGKSAFASDPQALPQQAPPQAQSGYTQSLPQSRPYATPAAQQAPPQALPGYTPPRALPENYTTYVPGTEPPPVQLIDGKYQHPIVYDETGRAWQGTRPVPANGEYWEPPAIPGVTPLFDWIGEKVGGMDWSTPGSRSRAKAKEEEERREREFLIDALRRKREKDKQDKTELASVTKTDKKRKDKREENVFNLDLSDWDALDPRQQAVIETNLTFVTAAENDRQWRRNALSNLEPEQRRAYLEDYEAVFGKPEEKIVQRGPGVFPTVEEAAPVVYAPETVAALRTLNVNAATNPYTVDEYLTGDNLTTSRQIANINKELPTGVSAGPQGSPYSKEPELNDRQRRLKFAQNIANAQIRLNTKVIEDEIEKGNSVLAGMSYNAVNEQAVEYGANEVGTNNPLTDANEEELARFLLGSLANAEFDPDESAADLYAEMARQGVAEDRQEAIVERMKALTVEGLRGGTWFENQAQQGMQVRNPRRVAKALQIPTVKSEREKG